jgi:aspartyl aminopeptidase
MVAGHIDALTARLKPTSTKPNSNGYVQLGVAQYAGALNETWWDRDLSVGGRVIVKDGETGKTSVKLVKLDWPSMFYPHQASALPEGKYTANRIALRRCFPVLQLPVFPR